MLVITFQSRLFGFSIFVTIECLYQIAVITCMKDIAIKDESCDYRFKKLTEIITFFTFATSQCNAYIGHNIAENTVFPNAMDEAFINEVKKLGPKSVNFAYIYAILLYYVLVLDVLAILYMMCIFCEAFSPENIGRGSCKYIFFPAIVLIIILSISDVVIVIYFLTRLVGIQKPSNWLLLNGYSKKDIDALYDINNYASEDMIHALNNVIVQPIVIFSRHGLSIFIFIVGAVWITVDICKIWKAKKKKTERVTQRNVTENYTVL